LVSNSITIISDFFKIRPTVHEFKHADGHAKDTTSSVSVVHRTH
jgi:hypothetical protein